MSRATWAAYREDNPDPDATGAKRDPAFPERIPVPFDNGTPVPLSGFKGGAP